MKDSQTVSSYHLPQSVLKSVRKCLFVSRTGHVVKNMTDEMRQNFSVGFGAELVSLAQKLFPKLVEILDHTIVDKRKFAALVQMRMGILIRDTAVRGPPGVSDPGAADNRFSLYQLRQVGDPACTLANFGSPAIAESRHTC
jgi:hypothetical protein